MDQAEAPAQGWPAGALDRYPRLAAIALRAPIALVSVSDHGAQRCTSAHGLGRNWSAAPELEAAHHLMERVAAQRATLVVNRAEPVDAAEDGDSGGSVRLAFAGVPLVTRTGHALGTLAVMDGEQRTWSAAELEALQQIADIMVTEIELRIVVSARSASLASARESDASELAPLSRVPRLESTPCPAGYGERASIDAAPSQVAQLIETLSLLAMADDLTGLHNRRSLVALAENQLEIAALTSRPQLLFYVDLDGMKAINDRLGHGAGDLAIRATATLLRATFRESDLLARLGGDEFIVLATDAAPEDADRLAARLNLAVAAYNALAGAPFRLSLSIGVTAYDPKRPEPLDALLKRADAAMYRHKQLHHAS